MKRIILTLFVIVTLISNIQAQIISLSLPVDNSVLNETNIYFSWLPVSSSGNTVRYEFKLVEILSGQNKTSALSYNTPVIEQQLLSTSYFSFTSLEPGKSYAWSVQAYYTRLNTEGETPYTERINLTTVGIAQFEINENIIDEENTNDGFIVLLKENTDPYIYFIYENQDTIRFKYTEEQDSSTALLQIYDSSVQEALDSIADFNIDTTTAARMKQLLPSSFYLSGIRRGENYIELPTSSFSVMPDPETIYFLEVKTRGGTIYRAKLEFE